MTRSQDRRLDLTRLADWAAAVLFILAAIWKAANDPSARSAMDPWACDSRIRWDLVPHFLAIAWIYREDYARAGLCMLPVLDSGGDWTAWHMVVYCLALLQLSVKPCYKFG